MNSNLPSNFKIFRVDPDLKLALTPVELPEAFSILYKRAVNDILLEMALVRRMMSDFTDPFMEMNSLMAPSMNDSFLNRRLFQDPWALSRRMGGEEYFSPKLDAWDTGNSVRVHVDLPGVPKENVSVEIHNGNLQIQGQTSQDEEYETFDSRVRERRYGKFSRILALPSDIDQSKVQAEFKNGVLELNIQKKPEAQPKRINVA